MTARAACIVGGDSTPNLKPQNVVRLTASAQVPLVLGGPIVQ